VVEITIDVLENDDGRHGGGHPYKELCLMVDGMKHLSIVGTGLSAILIAFLDHMEGWVTYIGRYVLPALFISICLSLFVIFLAMYEASRKNKRVATLILVSAALATPIFAISVVMLIPVARDVVALPGAAPKN
jgi:hypothetical protein